MGDNMAEIIGFAIWAICGLFFILLGIYCFFAKKEMGFWANAKVYPVNNVKKYNAAMGKLWITFGIIFTATGLPLLNADQAVGVLISIVAVMFEVIFMMVFYITVIEKKYRKK